MWTCLCCIPLSRRESTTPPPVQPQESGDTCVWTKALCKFCGVLSALLRYTTEQRPDALVFSKPRRFKDLKAHAAFCDLCKLMLAMVGEKGQYYKHGQVQDEEELVYSFPRDGPYSASPGITSLCLHRISAPVEVVRTVKTSEADEREVDSTDRVSLSSLIPQTDLLLFHDPLRWISKSHTKPPSRFVRVLEGPSDSSELLVRLDVMAEPGINLSDQIYVSH